MALTKKDYVAVAEVLKASIVANTGKFAEQAAVQAVGLELCAYFARTNLKFNQAIFRRAAAIN